MDKLQQHNQIHYDEFADPEITAKVQQYEMAYRMQTSVPEVTDLSGQPDHVIKLSGPDCLTPGTSAAHALLARKPVEKRGRIVQLYHQGLHRPGPLPSEMA